MLSSVLQCAAQLQTGLWDDSSPIAILYAIGHDKSGEPEMAIHCNTTPLCTVDIGGDAAPVASMEALRHNGHGIARAIHCINQGIAMAIHLKTF